MLEEDIDANVAAISLGGEEEVGLEEAEIGIDEGAWFEFEGAPVDAGGDLRGESVEELAAWRGELVAVLADLGEAYTASDD